MDPETCEVYVNEYKDHAGLQYHYDHRSTYDECIYGISLGCDGYMGFQHGSTNKGKPYKVSVPRGSLYMMTGQARNKFKHGINRGWIDGRRVSVTFRTIRTNKKKK